MKVAIEGCCHGQLDTIYTSIAALESQNSYKVDLLLICGDFQAIRNEHDLQCMAVPDKYKALGEFHKYYTGESIAPILTIVIGGNHEASNYFWELFHGGWIAPNIYFLGHAGSVLVNGIRIAGASGIFKGYNFNKGYYETQPYSKDDVRSIYHIRESSIRQLSLLPKPTIFLSHDWPLNITSYAPAADVNKLLRQKPHFRAEVNEGRLGSPPLMGLMKVLKPQWWFSAHLHVGFQTRVWWEEGMEGGEEMEGVESGRKEVKKEMEKNPDEIVIEDDEFETAAAAPVESSSTSALPPPPRAPANPDEIMLDDLDGDEAFDVAPPPPPIPAPIPEPPMSERGGSFTQFVALDKCLPRRKFLEVIDVETPVTPSESSESSSPSTPMLTYDPHWLAITRAFHSYISLERFQKPFPDEATARSMIENEVRWVRENVLGGKDGGEDVSGDDKGGDGAGAGRVSGVGGIKIDDVQVFVRTAPGPEGNGGGKGKVRVKQPPVYSNPQTEAFCRMLAMSNFVNPGAASS